MNEKNLEELRIELAKFYALPATKAQAAAINELREEYEVEKYNLARKFMERELAIFNDPKLKLQI